MSLRLFDPGSGEIEEVTPLNKEEFTAALRERTGVSHP